VTQPDDPRPGATADNRSRAAAEPPVRPAGLDFAQIVDDASDGVVVVTHAGEIAYINRVATELYGLPPDGIHGRVLSEVADITVMAPGGSNGVVERVRAGETWRGDVIVRSPTGTARRLEVTVNPIDLGEPDLGRIAVARDVTTSRAQTEMLDALLRASPLGIVAYDAQERVRYWSSAAERILGWPARDVVGTRGPVMADGDRAEIASIRERIGAGETVVRETRHVRPDGRAVDMRLWSAPLHDRDGAISGGVTFVDDLREERELEEQLRQSQKMEGIGRLAGGVAHDFNNILTAIMGYSFLLLETLPEGDDRDSVHAIARAADKAAALTRQLLAFSRRQILNPAVVDPDDVVRGIEPLIGRLIGEDIRFVTIPADQPARVRADVSQLEQVLMNLTVNARDAMPTGGRLTIEVARVELDEHYAATHLEVVPGPHVMIAVSDTGAGMTPEVVTRIFEPFFTTRQTSGGTGLGLSTVYGIVKQSGGSIGVYSEVGRGSVFKIYLPAAGTDVDPSPGHSEPWISLEGHETILLAEDDVAVREIAVMGLARHGYRVLVAEDGLDAINVARAHSGPIDLLVTDVVMGPMSGREVADALAEMRPGLRALFVSGYTENTVVHHGVLESGMNFLQKPFTPVALARRVRQLLSAEEPIPHG
jgi:PAS domain S-box-containing protein